MKLKKIKFQRKICCYSSFAVFLKQNEFKEFKFPESETDKCSVCENLYRETKEYDKLCKEYEGKKFQKKLKI